MERDDYILGFRPEDFLPTQVHEAQDNLVTFQFQVTRVENLGADRLVYGVLGDPFPHEKIISNLPSTMILPIQQGETYEFAVKQKDLKFFDRATGLRTDPRPL